MCVAYGHGGDGYASGHLHNGKKGIHAVESLGLNRNADYWKWGMAGHHAWEVSRPARACNDDLKASLVSALSVLGHISRCAMG